MRCYLLATLGQLEKKPPVGTLHTVKFIMGKQLVHDDHVLHPTEELCFYQMTR